jgi:outer membrane protein OmpA-like peptidoglycan-associated protein
MAFILLGSMTAMGCQSMSTTGKGAAGGAAAGGVIGAVIGKATGSTAKGAIIGAAVGGTAGAIIGNRMEQQAEELDQELENATVEPIMNPETGETAGIQLVFDNALLFDVGQATLRPNVQADLRQLAMSMQSYPDHDAVIVGHASTDGSDDLNQRLSEQRASAVRSFMMGQGVASGRLEALGMGETQPIAGIPGTDPANRRVEISLYANPNYQNAVESQQN